MVFLWMSIRIFLLGLERILGKIITRQTSSLISSWAFFGFSLLVLLPFSSRMNFQIFKFSLISGVIYSISFFLYMYSLSVEDVSVVAPLYNINAIFLIFIANIFLNEKITIYKILGSLMMIYGVSYLKKSNNILSSYLNILKSKGALAMIFSSLLIAVGRTVDGVFTKQKHFDQLGYSIGVYLIMSFNFFIVSFIKERGFKTHIEIVKHKWMFLIFGGICNAYAYVALLKVFKYIDVSIAEPLSMISVFVSILFAYLIFKERVKLRIIGTFFLIFGAFILYLG
ncbi:MAG: bacterial/archaeal transporter family protein [Thermosipho sp. (in: thermotogales)]|nr:bacterial/archaeal transporter family protein [Thermosipho sp. (in: thermotogales)]